MRDVSSADEGALASVVPVAVTFTVDVLWMVWMELMVVTP
jgi:hypothetical protein